MVIPARNAESELPATLASLSGVDVVVAVNGSSDRTAAVAREGGATVVELERPSRAAARNAGARAASGDVLLFTDAGCVADEGWVEGMSACLASAPLAGGPVRVTTSDSPSAAERFDALWRFQQEHAVKEGAWTAGANLGVTCEAFERVGGFDETLTAGDDVDLCRRVGSIAWCPEAVVSHPASRSLRDVGRRALRQGYSGTRLHGLHGVGHRHWRHPGGLVRGRAALRALGVDVDALEPSERRRMAMVARFDYACRFTGSAAAALRGAGR